MRCLSAYHETGDLWYGVWFVDYVLKVRGKRILGWSRGLKSTLGVFDKIDDGDSQNDKTPLLFVSGADLSKIGVNGMRDIIDDLNIGGLEDVENYLKCFRISYQFYDEGLQVLKERL